MDKELIERLWEACTDIGPDYIPANSPVVSHFAALVAEECAKIAETPDVGSQYDIAADIREKFAP